MHHPCSHSRILWFLFGAGSSTLFMWHREARHAHNSRYWGHCFRAPIHVPNHLAGGRDTMWPRMNPATPAPGSLEEQWERDTEKWLDTMADLSEATLESISNAIDILKARLAEHRAQREKRKEQDEKR
ncbi:hypothetical protein VKT23_014900 [Stygiomarasmius scandens]|uniref:Uncharacterized protein n=1 Tax=Marasmiellus scandens TaxID=2682957 RepID=A0ABR1J298_9AGAR